MSNLPWTQTFGYVWEYCPSKCIWIFSINIHENIPNNIPRIILKNIPKNIPDNIWKNIPTNIPKNILQNILENILHLNAICWFDRCSHLKTFKALHFVLGDPPTCVYFIGFTFFNADLQQLSRTFLYEIFSQVCQVGFCIYLHGVEIFS